MGLWLAELQDNNKETKALKSAAGLPKDWENNKKLLQYWELLYIPKIIHSKLISYHHNDPLTRYFGINKT